LNPQIPENLDSLVITILDSSTQTPKVQIGYYGWNIGTGIKITALWTITTSLNERPTHCEVAIIGDYSGKVVVGVTNHRDNADNPNRTSIQLIQDTNTALLATLGKQGGLSEGFADTLLLAVCADKSYFNSFVNQNTVNYGMVLQPDAEKKVKWSMAYSWAREADPLFRKSNWRDMLHPPVAVRQPERNKDDRKPLIINSTDQNMKARSFFTLSGRSVWLPSCEQLVSQQKANNIFILQKQDGTKIKIIGKRSP
jgi:hypothetical protein